MLTTEEAAKEREQGMAAGAAAYLIKPVNQQLLVQEVTRVLAGAIT